jgi:hypothetical protein
MWCIGLKNANTTYLKLASDGEITKEDIDLMV